MSETAAQEAFENALRKLVSEHVVPCYTWYSTHITWPRVMFRTAGMVVVIGSLSLPAIATSSLPSRNTLLTAVSLAVAILSSLNTFFRWDATWRSRARAGYSLQGLLATWEYGLTAAQRADNPEQAALVATEKLFKDSFALVGTETDEFFANVHWPEAPRTSGA